MYRPVWSDVVLAELEYEEAQKLIRRGEGEGQANERARHLIEQIRRAFDDAEVHGWEGLEGTYGLPDPDDEHLVAAAVVAGAGAIVTHNVADLPQEVRPTRLKAPKARRPASKAPVPKLVGSGNPSGWLPPGPSGCAHGSVSKDSATKLDHGEVAQFRAAGQWRLAEASRSPDPVVDLQCSTVNGCPDLCSQVDPGYLLPYQGPESRGCASHVRARPEALTHFGEGSMP